MAGRTVLESGLHSHLASIPLSPTVRHAIEAQQGKLHGTTIPSAAAVVALVPSATCNTGGLATCPQAEYLGPEG